MKHGLIPDTISRLEKVRAFAPNVIAQWQQEENDRAFIEWCRKEDPQPKQSIYGLPSKWVDKKKPWYIKLMMLIP